MPVAEIVARWRPGSYDIHPAESRSWTWDNEAEDLTRRDGAQLNLVAAAFMEEPILAGNDDRIWDGHHRIVSALKDNADLWVNIEPVEER